MMQTKDEKANCDSPKHTETALNNRFSRFTDKHQKIDNRGKSGKCNVCSTPCSSCFHIGKVFIKSGNESSGENYSENVEFGPELRSMTGMTSTSNSFSEAALVLESTRSSNTSALNDSVPRSQSECQRLTEVNDDCLSAISGTDENGIKKCHLNEHGVIGTGERMAQNTSITGLRSLDSSLGQVPSKVTDEAVKMKNVHNPFSETSNHHDLAEGNLKEDKPVGTMKEPYSNTAGHMGILSPAVVPADMPAVSLTSMEKKEDLNLGTHNADEADDSDMVEQDVEVCDICGDAGREDLLAICSRCSDGAEHTYCMKEMLAKVPERNWICEECENLERPDTERPKKVDRVVEKEKNNSSGITSGEYVNGTDIEGQRRKVNPRIPSKRPRDDTDAEVSSKLKKQAIESRVGPSKSSNSDIATAASLSQRSSSRGLEKEKRQYSGETIQVNESTELTSAASETRLRSFLKSNSFNSLNSKPKVKLMDQPVIKRQQSVKEHASVRQNDEVFRSMGRSSSFKATNSVRIEPKVKMLSCRPSEIQVVKTKKQRTTFERQSSVKAEHSSITPSRSAPKNDKKPATNGEYSPLIAAVCKHETKHGKIDSVPPPLSRSSSFQTRKVLDGSTSVGDSRRPYANSSVGVSSCSGVNKIEKRSNQPPSSVDGSLPDGLAREANLINSGSQTKEYSGSHLARSSAKLSKDETPSVRAAIEAAFLKKPVTYLRNRNMGHPDASTILSTVCDVNSHQDCRVGSSERQKVPSDTEQADKFVASQNFTADNVKQETTNNLKQSSVLSAKDHSFAWQHDALSGNSSRYNFQNFPVAVPFFTKKMAIPEQESIWKGSFEISWSGKVIKSFDGIQAHLSSAASPKVIETVNKFKSRIVLNEVTRLSSWPKQFQEHGVRDDNIALFFFARDLESYNKIYKVTLDNMIKKDLALKGNIDDVELMIFPSNILPDVSQRWNMLFFLWGVFRAKKESCLQTNLELPNQVSSTYQGTPKPIMSLPDDRCLVKPTREVSPGLGDSVPVIGTLSEELQLLKVANRERGVEVPLSDSPDNKMNTSSPVGMNVNRAVCSQEAATTFQKGDISAHQSPSRGLGISSSCVEHIPVKLDASFDATPPQHCSIESTNISSGEEAGDGYFLCSNENTAKLGTDAVEPSMNHMSAKKYEGFPRDLNVEPDLCDNDESVIPGTRENLPLKFSDKDHRPSGSQMDPIDTERYFFPVKEPPAKDINFSSGSFTSLKMQMVEQDHTFERPPTLELALGSETKRPVRGSLIWPLGEGRVTEGLPKHEGISNPNEVSSASLSLSLSFPFPENEQESAAPKSEQRYSDRECVKVFFGDLKGK